MDSGACSARAAPGRVAGTILTVWVLVYSRATRLAGDDGFLEGRSTWQSRQCSPQPPSSKKERHMCPART